MMVYSAEAPEHVDVWVDKYAPLELRWWRNLDDPMTITRMQCSCGSPCSLEQLFPAARWTFSHDENALVSTTTALMKNDAKASMWREPDASWLREPILSYHCFMRQ